MTCQSPIPLNLVGSVIQGPKGPKGDKGDKGDRGPAGGEAAKNGLYVFNTLPEAMAALPTLPEQSSVLVGVNLTQEGITKQFTASEGSLVQVKYLDPVAYSSGLNVPSSLTTVSKDGVIYAPDPLLVPFTTGAWNAAQWRPVQNTKNTNQVYQFPTLGAAEAAAPTLPAGSAVIVEGDSQGYAAGGAYVKVSGVPADTVGVYSDLDAYSGKNTVVDVVGILGTARPTGIEGRFFLSPADPSVVPDGSVVRRLSDGRIARRKVFDCVEVGWFGAKGDSITDDTESIRQAANFAASNHRELLFGDGSYKLTSEIVIDGAETGFRSVRWRGTFTGTGALAGYAPDVGRAGTTIVTNGNPVLSVWFRRFFNENISIRGIACVDGPKTAPYAMKLKKGDPVGYPNEKRYISGHVFEDFATNGYADSVVFRGMYRKDRGGAYTDNYFGPTDFIRFYPYGGGTGIVAENATLNRLRIESSLFFSLTRGAIVKREAADLPIAASTEMMIMCQLDMVHFEDVRGIFRFSGKPASGDFMNYVTMIDVTRELCGLYTTTTGNPYGVIEYTNLIINGRHDQWGETTAPALGIGSTITTQVAWAGRVTASGAKSLSYEKVNAPSARFTLPASGTLIKNVVVAEGLGTAYDIDVRVVINDGGAGSKIYRAFGITRAGTGGHFITESGVLDGVSISTTATSNTSAVSVSITNATATPLTVDIEVLQNRTGAQLYFG